MPKVLNLRDGNVPRSSPTSVYIGRPSKWGNPFIIGRDGTREEVMEKYQEWLDVADSMNIFKALARQQLAGKDLVCWCAPEACHGDILLKIANP